MYTQCKHAIYTGIVLATLAVGSCAGYAVRKYSIDKAVAKGVTTTVDEVKKNVVNDTIDKKIQEAVPKK